jgi:aryl-alcohol dehydrogenase-like predicted oxidoreductase
MGSTTSPLTVEPRSRLGRTDLDVFPICLGGNVFGWTADEQQSRAVLDAYVGAEGNFIDTANSYLVEHGRSETTDHGAARAEPPGRDARTDARRGRPLVDFMATERA